MTQPLQYNIRTPEGSVYGPANLPTIAQWIREGRIHAGMQLAPEGTQNFQPVTAFPELAAALASPAPASTSPNPYPTTSPYPSAVPAYAAPAQTNGMALAALICPLVGIAVCMPVGAILGVVFGSIAKKQIRASNGAQGGEGLAQAGFIIGIIELVLTVLLVILYIAMFAFFAVARVGAGR